MVTDMSQIQIIKEKAFILIETKKEKINITIVNDKKNLWKDDLSKTLREIDNDIESITIIFQRTMNNGLITEKKINVKKRL